MNRFEYVYAAGGNGYTSVKLTPEELEMAADAVGWCDVCKGWENRSAAIHVYGECGFNAIEDKEFTEHWSATDILQSVLADDKIMQGIDEGA